MKEMIREIGIISFEPTVLYQDNKSTITIITQSTKFKKIKHLLTRINFIRQLYIDSLFVVKYIPTDQLHVDALTKPLTAQPHYRHTKTFGVIDIKRMYS